MFVGARTPGSYLGCQWSVGLVVEMLLLGCLVCIARRMASELFSVFHTQPLQFPVTAKYSNERSLLLSQGLCRANPDLLRYLAFQDLYNLSMQSVKRRQEIFSLGPPGGPSNWDVVYAECWQLITDFSNQFVTEPSSDPLPHLLTPPSTGSPVRRQITDIMDCPRGMSYHELSWEKARLWSESPRVEKGAGSPPEGKSIKTAVSEALENASKRCLSWSGGIISYLSKRKLFAYFLKEIPHSKDAIPFKNFQLVIWCIEGLSQLALCSYHEDKYGVVQKDLPAICMSLIHLSKALDVLVKAPIPLSCTKRNIVYDLESNAKYATRAGEVLCRRHKHILSHKSGPL
jgi:hypothetical protein